MKDKAGGRRGRRMGTALLRDALGLGVAVSTGSFAINRCWVMHQSKKLARG